MHNLFSHFLKDLVCQVCRSKKVTRALCTRNLDDRADRIKIAERFGDMFTADHKLLNEDQESRLHHNYAVVVQALATQWIQSYPCRTKSASRVAEKAENILASRIKPKIHLYDQFSRIFKACAEFESES